MQLSESKWSKYYDNSKFETTINPNQTIYCVLKDSAQRFGDRVALEYGFTKITYAQLLANVDRLASAMRRIGIKKGDVITLSHTGMPPSVNVIYAASKVGAIVSAINNALTSARLKDIVEITDSRCFFVSNWKISEFMDYFESVENDIVICSVKTMEYTDFRYKILPIFHKYRVRDANNEYKHIKSDKVKVYDRQSLFDSEVEEFEPCADFNAPAIIFHSGSATGTPIPVVGSSKSLNYKAIATCYISNLCKEKDEPLRILSCVKQSFSFGLTLAIHSSIAQGNTIILYPDAGIANPEREILKFKPDVLIGYPKICTSMLESRKFTNSDLSFLKQYISAGESMTGLLTEEFRQFLASHKSEAKIYRLYGLTESMSAVCYNPPEFGNDRVLGIPLPGVNMKIMDRATGAEMPVGIKGEICISYPGNMIGYYKNPEITAEMMKVLKDGKTWLFTGDYGREDENGFFTFEGHSKRVVDMGDVHVYPEIIESEIKNLFGVEECCVVPVGHVGDYSLTAVVVPIADFIADNDKLENLKEKIISYTREIFFKEMRPSRIEFRVYLPKKGGDEIDYEELRRQLNTTDEEEEEF